MKKILSIARKTITEFIRNRAFLFMLLIALSIMVAVSVLTPAISLEDKVKLVLRITFMLSGLFSASLIIFFIVTTTYRDIDEKTILTLFSKPVSRSVYIVGKSVGFIVISFIIVFSLAGISFLYLELAQGGTVTSTKLGNPIKYIRGDGPVITGETSRVDGIPGQTVAVGETANVEWLFNEIDHYPFKKETVNIGLRIGAINTGSNAGSAFVAVDVLNNESISLQETQYVYVGSMNPNSTITIDRELVKRNKSIKVRVTPEGRNFYIFPQKQDVTFMLTNTYSFTSNYFRAFGYIFFMVSLLSIITLSIAVVFGQKMALVLSFFAYVTGNTLAYLKDFGELIGMRSVAEMQSFVPGHGHLHQVETLSKLPDYLVSGFHITVLKKFVIYLSSLFPNLKKFDPSEYFLNGTYIDNVTFLVIIAYAGIYTTIFLIISWLCFRRRELVSR